MEMRLVKELVEIEVNKVSRKFYTFFIELPNGMSLRVQPNSYKDKDGKFHSNYKELVLIADDRLSFDK